MSYKTPPFPCTFDECNDLPTCRTTQTCKEEAEISLQVSLALQKKKMCLLSKLHKAVRKWSKSQKNNPDYFTTDFVMDSSSWQMYLFTENLLLYWYFLFHNEINASCPHDSELGNIYLPLT